MCGKDYKQRHVSHKIPNLKIKFYFIGFWSQNMIRSPSEGGNSRYSTFMEQKARRTEMVEFVM